MPKIISEIGTGRKVSKKRANSIGEALHQESNMRKERSQNRRKEQLKQDRARRNQKGGVSKHSSKLLIK